MSGAKWSSTDKPIFKLIKTMERNVKYEVTPLDESLPFGAVVTGFHTGMLEEPGVEQALRDLWIDRGLIVFRGVPGAKEEHVRLSRVFGEPEAHPLRPKVYDPNWEVSDIAYDPLEGDLYELAGGIQRGSWLPWHFDLAYVERINHGG